MAGLNGAVKHVSSTFSRSDVIALAVIVLTVMGSAAGLGAYVGSAIASVEARLVSLEDFADDGSRCTGEKCAVLEERIEKLETTDDKLNTKIDTLPRPQPWFKNQVDELREVTASLRDQVVELTVQVKDLTRSPSRMHWSPNDVMLPGVTGNGR